MKNKILVLIFLSLILIIFAEGFISGACSGIVHACSSHNGNQSACTSAGCNYNSNQNTCTSSNHIGCSTYTEQSSCELHACIWTPASASEGGGGGVQPVIGIFPRNPLGGDNVGYKKVIQLEVQIFYLGKPSNGPSVKANSTMFGEINLNHHKGSSDGTYMANVTLKEAILPGVQRILYTAEYSNQFNEASFLINLVYPLKINTSLKQEYRKGEDIIFKGEVLDLDNLPIKKANINIKGYVQKNKIFDISTISNENGSFSADYFLKYYDQEGTWDIIITALSEDGRIGGINLPIEVLSASGVDYYFVNFLSPLENSVYKRGEIIPITIEVKDIETAVEGASVVISDLNKELTTLKEVQPGIYAGEYLVKLDDEIGKLFFKAEVIKQTENFKKVGGANIPLEIESAKMNFAFISPETDVTYTNSRLKIKLRLSYPDGSLVKGASIDVSLSNGKNIFLTETADGIYNGDYFVPEEDLGSLTLAVSVKDIEENIGELTKTIYIKKRSAIENILSLVLDFIKKYLWVIIIFLIISVLIYRVNFEIAWFENKLVKIREEMKRIKSMQIETEKKYFKEGSLSKREFKGIMAKYEERLAKSQETMNYYEKKLLEKLNQYKQNK
jgi:hypothetical protein